MYRITILFLLIVLFPELAFADPVSIAVGTAASIAGAHAAGVALTTAFIATTFAINVALGVVSSLLTPKPPSGGGFSIPDQGYTQQFRQAVSPREIVYGEVRKSGATVYIGTTDNNKYMHVVIALATHEVQEIGEIWVDDYSIPSDDIDGSGNVINGRYENKMRIKKHLGTDGQAADSDLISDVTEWTSDHKLSGIAYLYVRMEWNRDLYPNGTPNISAWVKGKKIYDIRSETTYWTPNIGALSYDYLTYDLGLNTNLNNVSTQSDAYYTDDALSNRYYTDNSTADPLFSKLVTASNADTTLIGTLNLCEEYVTVTSVSYSVTDVDTTNDLLTIDGDRLGLVFGDVIQISSGSIGGFLGGTDYYVVPYQRKDTLRIYIASSLANALAGTYVSLTSGTTATIQKTKEPRYFGGGVIRVDTERDSNMKQILTAMAGQAVYSGGSWNIYGGEYQAPTISFGMGDLASGIEISPKLSKKDRFNRVQGVYISPFNDDNPADYPLVKNDTYATNDGQILKKDLDLPFVQKPHHAQRVSKIFLERARQDIIFKAAFKLTAFKVQVGDNFYFNFERFGWTNKIFEVIDWELSLGDGAPVINITARENASGVYDWNSGEETAVDLAPNTSLDSPFVVDVVGGFSLDSLLVSTQAEDKIFSVVASWDSHPDQFVLSGGRYEVEFKESTQTTYNSAGKVDGSISELVLPSLKPDVLYDIRIFAYNTLDIQSAASEISGFLVGSTVTTNTEDWENETLARDGDDWESDTLTTEDWE